jgi:hypothetical protein
LYFVACIASLQAKDDMHATRGLFSRFVDDDTSMGQMAEVSDACTQVILEARATEFESWIVRIALGGADTRAKNPSKALSSKHKAFVACGGEGSVHVLPCLWKEAKALLGST